MGGAVTAWGEGVSSGCNSLITAATLTVVTEQRPSIVKKNTKALLVMTNGSTLPSFYRNFSMLWNSWHSNANCLHAIYLCACLCGKSWSAASPLVTPNKTQPTPRPARPGPVWSVAFKSQNHNSLQAHTLSDTQCTLIPFAHRSKCKPKRPDMT